MNKSELLRFLWQLLYEGELPVSSGTIFRRRPEMSHKAESVSNVMITGAGASDPYSIENLFIQLRKLKRKINDDNENKSSQ
jgi:hypothetical protein